MWLLPLLGRALGAALLFGCIGVFCALFWVMMLGWCWAAFLAIFLGLLEIGSGNSGYFFNRIAAINSGWSILAGVTSLAVAGFVHGWRSQEDPIFKFWRCHAAAWRGAAFCGTAGMASGFVVGWIVPQLPQWTLHLYFTPFELRGAFDRVGLAVCGAIWGVTVGHIIGWAIGALSPVDMEKALALLKAQFPPRDVP